MRHQLHHYRVIAVFSVRIELLEAGRSLDKRFLPFGVEVQRISENHSRLGICASGNNFLNFSVCLLVHPTASNLVSNGGELEGHLLIDDLGCVPGCTAEVQALDLALVDVLDHFSELVAYRKVPLNENSVGNCTSWRVHENVSKQSKIFQQLTSNFMLIRVRLRILEFHSSTLIFLRGTSSPRHFRPETRWMRSVGAQVLKQKTELLVNLKWIL